MTYLDDWWNWMDGECTFVSVKHRHIGACDCDTIFVTQYVMPFILYTLKHLLGLFSFEKDVDFINQS